MRFYLALLVAVPLAAQHDMSNMPGMPDMPGMHHDTSATAPASIRHRRR